MRVLVVDDDRSLCELIHDALARRGHEVRWRTRAEEALLVLEQEDFDVVVTDLDLGEAPGGLALCERVVTNRPDLPVVVITAFGSMDSAIQALRAGAFDFIQKPVDLQVLELTLERAAAHRALGREVKRLREAVEQEQGLDDIVGASPAMRKVFDLVARVAESDATVLITGESGTGKELVARAIHARSERRGGHFVAINCAAMPPTLLESELFGHVKGAFTDARRSRDGLFLQATGGTLFLDEIGELPLEMQPKLLRALQERRLRPVGGDAEVAFDTRILAATNRDLEAEVEGGRFREDLFYRVNVVQVHVPPLRSRGQDILLLAQRFVERLRARLGKQVSGLSTGAAQRLLEYDWPGNVRELENCMERAVTLTRFDQITVDDLPDKVRSYQSSRLVIADDDPEQLLSLDDLERRYIQRVLKAVGGNKTRAAKVLGLDRRTLYRKLDRFEGRAEAS